MSNDVTIKPQRIKRIYEFAILPYPESLDAFTHRNPHAFAALRVLFALAAIARSQRTHPGSAMREMFDPFYAVYSEIQKVAYINRSEIKPALALLREQSLIQFSAQPGVKTLYTFCFGVSRRWVQVPLIFYKTDALKVLSLTYTHFAVRERHQYLMGALKLYLYLLMTRENRTNRSYASYLLIEAACKIQKKLIRRTLNILVSENLISTESRFRPQGGAQGVPEIQGYKRANNAYFVIGLRDFFPLPNLVPSDSAVPLTDFDEGDEQVAS